MTKTKDIWRLIVDVAPPDGQLAFITDIVARLAAASRETGKLPEPLDIRINHGSIAGPELVVHPVGAIKDKLIVLADALADQGHFPKFHAASADVVDVQCDDLVTGSDVPRRSGLHLSYDGLPVLVIHGDAGHLLLTMDGFERSMIGMTEEIPGLWERVRRATGAVIDKVQAAARMGPRSAEGQRRRAGAGRDVLQMRREFSGPVGQLGLTLPAVTIRPIPSHVDASLTASGDALLVPVQGQKATSGDYPPRAALEMLRAGLGVQTVLTDYRLRVLLQSRDRAHDELAAVLPISVRHLRDVGTACLSDWTGFDTVGQVQDWANANHAGRPVVRNVARALIDAELISAKILSQALLHAERVVNAHDRGERQSPEAAAETLARAYKESRGSSMSVGDLVQVAALTNINPLIFWQLPHDEHALFFDGPGPGGSQIDVATSGSGGRSRDPRRQRRSEQYGRSHGRGPPSRGGGGQVGGTAKTAAVACSCRRR